MSRYGDFNGTSPIVLQPLTKRVPYAFTITEKTSETSKGWLIYGTNVIDAEVTAFDDEGNEVTDLIDSTNLVDNVITVKLTYPSAGEGYYSLRFKLIIDNDSEEEVDFSRINAVQKGFG